MRRYEPEPSETGDDRAFDPALLIALEALRRQYETDSLDPKLKRHAWPARDAVFRELREGQIYAASQLPEDERQSGDQVSQEDAVDAPGWRREAEFQQAFWPLYGMLVTVVDDLGEPPGVN